MRRKRLFIALLLLVLAFVSSLIFPFDGLIHRQPAPAAAPDPGCTLANQILAANTDQAVGDCRAGDGDDVIKIRENIVLNKPLPVIASNIIIVGDGHTISGDGKHRIFMVRNGSLMLQDLRLTTGSASEGGAILLLINSRVTLHRSSISDSAAVNGGAIYNRVDTLAIHKSTISGNRAEEAGGGIYNRHNLSVSNSSFVDNLAKQGGAIYDHYGRLHVSNSTFSGNHAKYRGGALLDNGYKAFDLEHVTITNNSAMQGGGLVSRRGHFRLVNSIVAGNRGGDCADDVIENINSLVGDGSCAISFSGDPSLLPLTGAPPYHPLDADSPALGAGSSAQCPMRDQRGVLRPKARCDLGAYQSSD